jgi:hypothetical protein
MFFKEESWCVPVGEGGIVAQSRLFVFFFRVAEPANPTGIETVWRNEESMMDESPVHTYGRYCPTALSHRFVAPKQRLHRQQPTQNRYTFAPLELLFRPAVDPERW